MLLVIEHWQNCISLFGYKKKMFYFKRIQTNRLNQSFSKTFHCYFWETFDFSWHLAFDTWELYFITSRFSQQTINKQIRRPSRSCTQTEHQTKQTNDNIGQFTTQIINWGNGRVCRSTVTGEEVMDMTLLYTDYSNLISLPLHLNTTIAADYWQG